MIGETNKYLNILLVEDSASDAALIRRGLSQSKIKNQTHWLEDGERAIAYLRQQEPYTKAPRPDLVLLDLNLPRLDGREVLHQIKSDPDLKEIPVIVITTSAAEKDIQQSYLLYANCYIVKPFDVQSFLQMIQTVDSFWLRTAALPSQ
ncbi:MAG: response regulator [Leptolyngbya sp. SIO4C5]|uniref:response regulator n=1 Tax=Sphaerothrix gracilis TaxID=3151835 RepID=UPI0013BF6831|nr:response regulator [Leptolyngbya sp. SIO4C5]